MAVMVDAAMLCSVLQNALSTNKEERKAGELQLDQMKHLPGHMGSMLQVIASAQIEPGVRQFCAIYLKNMVHKDWGPREVEDTQPSRFLPEEKQILRDNLVEAIIHTPHEIRSQLGECMRMLVMSDFPESWPGLPVQIDGHLRSQDHNRTYAALLALRLLSRKYEFKDEEERGPMRPIVNAFFPIILQMAEALLQVENPGAEVAELLKLICKIYWSSTYLEMPPTLMEPNVFSSWMTFFQALIHKPVPVDATPAGARDRESLDNSPWWKCKKWALQVINRFFSRYGNPKMSPDELKPFATMFQKHFANKFLETYCNLLSVLRSGGHLSDRVVNLALQYLTYSISRASTFKVLKPHMDVIIFEILFKSMCFNDADDELWKEDPHEYVRKGYDIIQDMYSSRTAAINFLLEIVRVRGKTYLPRILAFVVTVFTRYNETPPQHRNSREKDGVMLVVGSLADKLKSKKEYKHSLEAMLELQVLPEFQNPEGHLRAKACWLAGQYADIPFQNHATFTSLLGNVMNCLRDPELPVRVDAVVALRAFVDASQDLNELRPILPQLLDEFFKLMNEVENEDLVFTLETIVDKFGEEIAPYALGLTQNLTAAFWRCIASEEEDDMDVGMLAAVGCLRAIATILDSVSSLPALYPQLEAILMPILIRMLTSDGQDIYEEVLEILSFLTYYTPVISPDLWKLWPVMVAAVDEWALDYLDKILIPLDNYVSRGTQVYLTSTEPNYQESLYRLVAKCLADENVEESDCLPAPKLISAVLQNCRGHVDVWIEPFAKLVVNKLRVCTKAGLKDLLINVLADILYYNPGLGVTVLMRLGVMGEVLHKWMELLYKTNPVGKMQHFKRVYDKKVGTLGLVSLLMLPVDQLPAELAAPEALAQVVKGTLKLLVDMKQQMEEDASRRFSTAVFWRAHSHVADQVKCKEVPAVA
eukprot:jgi/Mesvir1/7100/Mv09206-RA.2